MIFELNQLPSNLTEWEKIPEGDSLSIAYMVDQYRFMYEPIYVAKADSPQFDERFVGYGMTRNTQVNSLNPSTEAAIGKNEITWPTIVVLVISMVG